LKTPLLPRETPNIDEVSFGSVGDMPAFHF
jgi:hypothetical protein